MDGFNLYYRLKSTCYKWLNLEVLINSILKEYHEVVKIKYFTALVKGSDHVSSRPNKQMTYWGALQSISNLEIIKGRFKKRTVKGQYHLPKIQGINQGDIVTIKKYEEKESDVNMASHILLDCVKSGNDCTVLLSNDTDLLTPLSMARKEFGKKIGIISPSKQTHEALKRISHFSVAITDEQLKKSQFSVNVDRYRKPINW